MPNNGIFTIKTDYEFEKKLRLINSIGEVVFETTFRPEIIDLNLKLASGIYVLEILSKGEKQQQKVVIAN